ncbi:rab3 GTPase-activating protein non-catalytic subunit-like, partial [Saccoglossus kowalevskii]
EESLVHTLLDMKIASLRQQALERILSAKIGLKPALIMRIVSDVAEQINSQDVESRDYESKCLLRYCNVQLQLLYSYNAIDKAIKMTAQSPDGATQGIEQDLISVLNCTKSEVEYLLNLLNDYQQDSHRPRVHFQEDHILDTAGFISCFDMNCYHHGDRVKHSDDDNDNDDNAIPVYLFENLSEEQHVQLGVFLFGNVLAGSSSVNDVSMAIKSVGLSANTLMSTLLCLWLSTEHHYYNDLSSLQYLKELIYDICHMVDEKQTKPPVDAVSPWWQSIRDILSQSTNVGAALTAAMVTRSVAMGMVFRDHNSSGKRKDVEEKHLDEETEKDCDESEMECSSSDKSPDTESLISEGWVSISVDMELWNLLVHQLEDVTTVKCLLLTKPSKIARNQASSSTKAWTSSQDFFCIVAEVIARWVAKYCVPHTILDSIHPMTDSFEKHASYVPMVTKDTAVQDELNQISGLLSSLRKRFPISLQPDLLYAHCTWEYIVSWNKQTEIEPEASIVPTFEIEDNWEKIEGPTSIAELAIDQPLCNYALVDLHKQLCTILNSVLAFYMRSVKPLSLFNSKGRNALFKDLNSNPPLPSHDVDVSLLNSRQKFLCRVITASVGTVELMEDSSTRHVSLEWPLTIIQLGMALNVDVDLLKRHYVYQLYGSGYDAMAQEVLHTVHEHAEMGVLLLRIVGYRLAHLVVNPDAAHVEKLSRLPVPLVAWIKGLDESDVRNVNIPLTDTAILIGHIVNQLPENHPLYSLSVQLVEAIDALR